MYRYALGDKDLYRLAFVLAGKDSSFQQLPLLPRVALAVYDPSTGTTEVRTVVWYIVTRGGRILPNTDVVSSTAPGGNPRSSTLYP